MQHSDQIDQIAAALAAARPKFGPIRRGRTARVRSKSGADFSYQYASLEDVLDAVSAPLAAQGLALVQSVGTAPDGGLTLTTRLLHASGQWLGDVMPLDAPSDARMSDVQALGSSLTYLRRYTACALLGVTAEDDDDGASSRATYTRGPSGGRPAPSRPPEGSAPDARQSAARERLEALGLLADACAALGPLTSWGDDELDTVARALRTVATEARVTVRALAREHLTPARVGLFTREVTP